MRVDIATVGGYINAGLRVKASLTMGRLCLALLPCVSHYNSIGSSFSFFKDPSPSCYGFSLTLSFLPPSILSPLLFLVLTCSCVMGMRRCLDSSLRVPTSVLMSSLQPTRTTLALGQNSWVSPCHCGMDTQAGAC